MGGNGYNSPRALAQDWTRLRVTTPPPPKPSFPFAPKNSTPPPPVAGGATTPGFPSSPLPEDGGAIPLTNRAEPVSRVHLTDTQGRIPLAESQPSGDDEPATQFIPSPGSAAAALPSGPITAIGPYKVLRQLARGGMGAVYLGEDSALDRRVAIKVMARELIHDEDAMVRFQREARATAAIVHPNIALIYLVGLAEEGSPFIAMEFIGGGTIERLIREKIRVPFSKVADLMIQCAEALNAGQKKGIIHRDIKPGNIMLTDDWTVKLVDFGLAKFFHEDSYRTVAGMVMGTPRYMAPEQTQGREVDFRADMYSLGATFYHLLTGRPPFDGDNPTKIMLKHVTSPIVPMRSINPEVPMEFDDVIRKCLAKDPNDRFPTYLDLITDLSRIKLQWTARERGSLVSSASDLPTLRMGSDGMPLAPGQKTSRFAPPGGGGIDEHTAPHEEVPVWRYVVLVVLGGLLVVGAVALLLRRPPAPPVVADDAPREKTGFVLLLERLAGKDGDTPTRASERDPDFIAYLATREIVSELGKGITVYRMKEGKEPPNLRALHESGAATEIYEVDGRGTPRDGWGYKMMYSPGERIVYSVGLDGTDNTADDIRADASGVVTINDEVPYNKLEEADYDRRQREK